MTNTELAKQHGATTYTNRHSPDDPYIAMSRLQLDAYTQAAIAAQAVQAEELKRAAYSAGWMDALHAVERDKAWHAAQLVKPKEPK